MLIFRNPKSYFYFCAWFDHINWYNNWVEVLRNCEGQYLISTLGGFHSKPTDTPHPYVQLLVLKTGVRCALKPPDWDELYRKLGFDHPIIKELYEYQRQNNFTYSAPIPYETWAKLKW